MKNDLRVLFRGILHLTRSFCSCVFQTEGDGNCLLRAVLNCCDMEDQFEGQKYGFHQLRLQAVEHMVTHRDLLFDTLKEEIRMTYGALEDVEANEAGGYSYKTYCQYMRQNGTWCDLIMLKVIASMWSCRISVIHADTFYQTKIRHDGHPNHADIVLVFNASYHHGHYITTVRTNGENFILGIPEKHECYDRDSDRVERAKRKEFDWCEEGEKELVVVPLEVYKMLIYKSEQYDKMVELAKKPTPDLESQPEPRLPSLDPDNEATRKGSGGGGSASKKRKDKDKDDNDDDDDDDDGVERDPADPTTRKKKGGRYQSEEKIADEELGRDVTICPRCKLDQKTHSRLITHVKKYHEDIFNFLCKKCDRGFITRDGWKTHMKSHDDEAKRLKCPKGCKQTFVDKKSLKGHMRKIHPEGGIKDLPCPFKDCGKIFYNKTNLDQHKRSCKKNPNREELFCHICDKGGFWNQNKLMEHKRDVHGWR